MKRKLSFLFLSALTIPFFMGSCSDDKEEQEVKPATDLVVDNNSVTLLQGDEITVSITSGNGDYYVKPFDENVATATINGNKVTIKATENSQLEENNRTETTILIVEGVGGTTVFENWGNGGSGLDAQVCLQNISENKPAWGAELPATYNGDKSRFEPIECPHSY